MLSRKDFSTALHSLSNAKGYALTIVLTLGLTLGALVAVFNLNYQLLAAPLPYPHAERLVKLASQRFAAGVLEADRSAPYPLWFELYERADELFEQKALLAYTTSIERRLPDSPTLTTVATTPEFLTMVDAPMALGRTFNRAEGLHAMTPVAVISYRTWQTIFQRDPEVLGKTLNIMEIDFKIIGVLAQDFIEPSIYQTGMHTDLWLPIDYDDMPPPYRKRWDSSRTSTFLVGLLKPEVSQARANQELNQFAEARINAETRILSGHTDTSVKFNLQPFKAAIVGDADQQSLLMLAGALLLLLMAATTIVNLMLARAANQARRHAIQVALGAQPRHIFSGLFADIFLLVAAAEMLALGVAYGMLQVFKKVLDGQLPRLEELQLNSISLLFCLALGVLLALAFAYLISRQINYRKLNHILQSGGKGIGLQVSATTRRLLILTQVAFTSLLLSASLHVLVYSAQQLRQPLGYTIENQYQVRLSIATLWQTHTPEQRRNFFYQLVDDLQQDARIEAIGLSTSSPIDHFPPHSELVLTEPGADNQQDPLKKIQAKRTYCDGSLLNILQIPLVAGRYFSDAEVRAGEHLILVNETLADKIQADGQVLGQRLYRPGNPTGFVIVGILRDLQLPGEPESPRFFQAAIVEGPQLLIKVKPGQTLAPRDINSAAAQIHPQIKVFEMLTADEALAQLTGRYKTAAGLAAFLSLLALSLAAMGIYGVLSYSVQLRKFELGIRMALGVPPLGVFRQILTDNLSPVFGGLLCACATISVVGFWLSQGRYDFHPSLWSYLLPALFIFALTAAATLLSLWNIIRRPACFALANN